VKDGIGDSKISSSHKKNTGAEEEFGLIFIERGSLGAAAQA
jgi:hypothetical protein